MKKFVSLDKQSKKARKEYYSGRRRTWGDVNPVTRSVPSGKTYNRKKDKQKLRKTGRDSVDGFDAGFFIISVKSNQLQNLVPSNISD